MADITVRADGTQLTLPADATAADALAAAAGSTLASDVIVARVDGELRDLEHRLASGAEVEPVHADSSDGLAVLRHSCAHVLAQAVQAAHPDARLGIGPPVTDGFYYDFDVAQPFTPEDVTAL